MRNWRQFEKYVATIMENEQIPGVAVSVSEDGEVIYERGFGKADLTTQEAVTPETIFGTASITKTFVGLAILMLAEREALMLNDAVKKHLPEFQLTDLQLTEDIQIHHLLSHTTGVPTIKRKEFLTNFTQHLAYLKEVEFRPLGKPGEYFCYNNDLFLLLGAIIERVTGENYKEFIKKEIIMPQNMNRTTFYLEELQQFENVATPYILKDGEPVECAWPTLGNYAVGGGIRSSVSDLQKYGRIFMDQTNTFTHNMRIPVHRTLGTSSYGYAAQITPDYAGVTLVEHGGGQPGVSSNFGYIPEKGLVIAVLTNITGVRAEAIWLAAANTALGIPVNRKRSIEPHYYMKENELSKFIGTYKTGEGATLLISAVIGQLQASIDGETFMLRASNEQTLVMTPTEKSMRFYFDETEQAWAVLVGLRMYVKEGEEDETNYWHNNRCR